MPKIKVPVPKDFDIFAGAPDVEMGAVKGMEAEGFVGSELLLVPFDRLDVGYATVRLEVLTTDPVVTKPLDTVDKGG